MKRICKYCGVEKELVDFGKHSECMCGYGWKCKTCKNIQSKQHRID